MSTESGVSCTAQIRHARTSGHKLLVKALKYKGLRKTKMQMKYLDGPEQDFSEKDGHAGERVHGIAAQMLETCGFGRMGFAKKVRKKVEKAFKRVLQFRVLCFII